MNVLDYLTKKKNSQTPPTHPLSQRTSEFKYSYCFGLAVLVYGYKEQMEVTLDCFSSILNRIQLEPSIQQQLSVQVKKQFDTKINNVFRDICTKDEQYCFIADLYRLSFFGLISPTFSHDIIEGYTQVFNFSQSEKTFLQEFTNLAYQTLDEFKKNTLSYYDTKLDAAITLYENFELSGFTISSSILRYIYPGFYLSSSIEGFTLEPGSVKRFQSEVHITGDIIVSRCSTLIFDHAKVYLNGSISVNNGKFLMKHSDIVIEHNNSSHFILAKDAPLISIEDSSIDCNSHCGFLNQQTGHLKVQNTSIKHTTGDYGIRFWGNSADIERCHFEHCENGAFFNGAKNELFIGSSSFSSCYNDYGGAIFSDALANTTIYNCHFHNCRAKYIGGAIYFKHLKYGQSVMHCEFEHCTPSDNFLFNAYERGGYDLYD